MLDLHGGAWNAKDRHAEEPMDRALASSGLLVVAIDMTLAPEAPYPACVQDANYARALAQIERRARGMATPSKIGVYGSSSGGHVAELLAMRPRDPRYNAIPLPEAPKVDATVAYVAMRSPVSNPLARYENAEKLKRERDDEEPHDVLRPVGHDPRKQPAGDSGTPRESDDGAVPDHAGRARRQRAVRRCRRSSPQTYKAAGGDVQFHVFEGSEHEWVAKPGPQTDNAREMVKAFIARQLNR